MAFYQIYTPMSTLFCHKPLNYNWLREQHGMHSWPKRRPEETFRHASVLRDLTGLRKTPLERVCPTRRAGLHDRQAVCPTRCISP